MKHTYKRKINRIIRLLTVAAVLCIGGYAAFHSLHLGHVEFTENAQVKQFVVPVNSRVQGYIRRIDFEEFRPVVAGDTLAVIEDEPYRLRVAEAEVAYQKTLTEQTEIELALLAAKNDIEIAESQVEKARIERDNARTTYERYQKLLAKDAVTREQFDNARTDYNVKTTHHETLVKQRQSSVLQQRRQEQQLKQVKARTRLAELEREMALLNLSYTVIVAPCEGVMGRKAIQVGQLVQNGQTLVNIVDSREKWISANFRESQIAHLRQRQRVEIRADALPGEKFTGVIRSLSDATGSAFSLIPQDNATGNFVKVEQRVPVRIEFDEETPPEKLKLLRAGMNVECLIRY